MRSLLASGQVYERAKKSGTVAYGHGGMQAASIDRVGIMTDSLIGKDAVVAGPVVVKDEILSMQHMLADSDHLSVMVTHGMQIKGKGAPSEGDQGLERKPYTGLPMQPPLAALHKAVENLEREIAELL